MSGPLYMVEQRSCDDGCMEFVRLFDDPELAGHYANESGGVVRPVYVEGIPSPMEPCRCVSERRVKKFGKAIEENMPR